MVLRLLEQPMQLQTRHLKTTDEDVVVDLFTVAEGGSS